MSIRCLLTCEHVTNFVPAEYRHVFRGHREALHSHRGYDLGTDIVAQTFRDVLRAPLIKARVSRLLIELNRSLHHPQLFSEFSSKLSDRQRERLIETYYTPYRSKVEGQIRDWISQRHRVVHLSLHSFTPELHGEVRTADIGLLYDPARRLERAFCDDWKRCLARVGSQWRVRRNYPYLGKADGFTTALRRLFTPLQYVGIELEVNQKWSTTLPFWRQLAKMLATTCAETLAAPSTKPTRNKTS